MDIREKDDKYLFELASSSYLNYFLKNYLQFHDCVHVNFVSVVMQTLNSYPQIIELLCGMGQDLVSDHGEDHPSGKCVYQLKQ